MISIYWLIMTCAENLARLPSSDWLCHIPALPNVVLFCFPSWKLCRSGNIRIRTKRPLNCSNDAAIYGFAVGTGFALVENVYYLLSLPGAPAALWIVRGFGTAVMHGGTTAILAMARANGVPADDVFTANASRQSRLLNAHVSGFLGAARISIDDTTLSCRGCVKTAKQCKLSTNAGGL